MSRELGKCTTFRMLCVWMQDDADIFKISKLLEELPKVFFLGVKGQVSKKIQGHRRVSYNSEIYLQTSTGWIPS